MTFYNGTKLRLTYVRANGPDPDDTVVEYLFFPGGGAPRGAYSSLKGAATSMAWPQGSTTVPFSGIFPIGNNLLSDSFGEEYGIRSWSISGESSHIPGKLQVASYLDSNTDDASPDSVDSVTLDGGAWDSGALFVFTGAFGDPYYRLPRFRFIPGPLILPLGV